MMGGAEGRRGVNATDRPPTAVLNGSSLFLGKRKSSQNVSSRWDEQDGDSSSPEQSEGTVTRASSGDSVNSDPASSSPSLLLHGPGPSKRARSDDHHVVANTFRNLALDVDQTSITPPTAYTTTQQQFSHLLGTLNAEQLSSILQNLVSNHPQLLDVVTSLLPRPTIHSVTKLLEGYQARLESSFPFTKFGPDRTSDYAFNRVRPELADIQDTIIRYLSIFTNPATYRNAPQDFPAEAFQYLDIAFRFTHCTLPTWDSPQHCTLQHQIYRHIANGYKNVTRLCADEAKNQGRVYGMLMMKEWASQLHRIQEAMGGEYGFREVWEEFRMHFGWMLGL